MPGPLSVCVVALSLVGATAAAQTPVEAIDALLAIHDSARAAQRRVDAVHRELVDVQTERRLIEHEGTADALRQRELGVQIARLQQSVDELDTDLRAVTDTESGIVTLIASMTDALARFIELDLPFEREARLERVALLRARLVRSDLDIADKYQSVVTAYLDEIGYGTTNEVLRTRIATPSGPRVVDLLRLGRAGLWYLSLDETNAGRWDSTSVRYVEDPDIDIGQLRHAIAIVNGQRLPAAVVLPLERVSR